ncbi:hypothetical protein A2Y83_04735 [Candidatus Falkowbacteria bacterium RBG_13_39_14]|uniref:Hydrogenase maturation nickel metallochaperone HypA n=1 Tax=Candidatus Falkowbacteria bacterium RBG_13_39_14 TaxID=1797985 RepID=A0A1F5S165_9BACT|nr:MAG: hypothetical protein A2Y83_04735 [Candidatus Falkowbacteria bacterium RBG_13_39_14]
MEFCMHDIHLANQIVNLVKEHCEKEGIKIVKKIRIALGSGCEHGEIISADNLEFIIKLLLGDNVDVEIEKIAGDKRELVEIEGN